MSGFQGRFGEIRGDSGGFKVKNQYVPGSTEEEGGRAREFPPNVDRARLGGSERVNMEWMF